MDIIIKNILVKVYHSINIAKYYYKCLQQVYLIITIKISRFEFDLVFQMFFKAINN